MIREKIISVLKDKNLVKKEIAKKCNIDDSNFDKFLKGKKTLSLEKIERVLKYLNIKL